MDPQTFAQKNNELFLEITYLFILPVTLIYVGVVPYSWRVIVLFVVSLMIMGIMKYQHWSKEKMGVIPVTARAAIAYAVFALVGTVALIALAHRLGFKPLDLDDWFLSWRLILFFIPLSVLQEVAYRGYLSARLKELFSNPTHRVLINTGLFVLLHIIYPMQTLVMPIVFVAGLCFAALYERYPNLLLISIAHSILNFVAVLFGFFS